MSHLGDRLSALVDGELSHGERDRLHVHLAACAECRAEAAALRALKRRVGELGEAVMDARLVERLFALAEPGEPVPGRRRAFPGSARPRPALLTYSDTHFPGGQARGRRVPASRPAEGGARRKVARPGLAGRRGDLGSPRGGQAADVRTTWSPVSSPSSSVWADCRSLWVAGRVRRARALIRRWRCSQWSTPLRRVRSPSPIRPPRSCPRRTHRAEDRESRRPRGNPTGDQAGWFGSYVGGVAGPGPGTRARHHHGCRGALARGSEFAVPFSCRQARRRVGVPPPTAPLVTSRCRTARCGPSARPTTRACCCCGRRHPRDGLFPTKGCRSSPGGARTDRQRWLLMSHTSRGGERCCRLWVPVTRPVGRPSCRAGQERSQAMCLVLPRTPLPCFPQTTRSSRQELVRRVTGPPRSWRRFALTAPSPPSSGWTM